MVPVVIYVKYPDNHSKGNQYDEICRQGPDFHMFILVQLEDTGYTVIHFDRDRQGMQEKYVDTPMLVDGYW